MAVKNEKPFLKGGTRDAFQLMMSLSRDNLCVKQQYPAAKRRKLSCNKKKHQNIANPRVEAEGGRFLPPTSSTRCPSCMISTVSKSVQWTWSHLQQCLDVDRSSQKECPAGEDCTSSEVSHYFSFTHYKIAVQTSYPSSNDSSKEETQLPDIHTCANLDVLSPNSWLNKETASSCHNTLTLQKDLAMCEVSNDKSTLSYVEDSILPELADVISPEEDKVSADLSHLEASQADSAQPDQESNQYIMVKSCTKQCPITAYIKLEATRNKAANPHFSQKKDNVLPECASRHKRVQLIGKMRDVQYSGQDVAKKLGEVQWEEGKILGQTANCTPKQCPFYKKIPDTPFTVDAFNYGSVPGVRCYFLSHFHWDHYVGLTKSFRHAIYCSQVTANLVSLKIGVAKRFLHALPLNEPCIVEGIEIILLDANHCPGSVMFVFVLPNGTVFLHTGDFRACPSMESYRILNSGPIHRLYLDTTYCDPAYNFPPQTCILQFIASLVAEAEARNPQTLFICGSYTIGKEKVFLAVAKVLGCQIWARTEKQRVLRALEDIHITSRLVKDSRQAKVHVLPMQDLKPKVLHQYLAQFTGQYNAILALKPTGWEQTPNLTADNLKGIKPLRAGPVTIYGVPYSEHSSFDEMRRFVQFLQPRKIIPTVNIRSRIARLKMEATFKKWLN